MATDAEENGALNENTSENIEDITIELTDPSHDLTDQSLADRVILQSPSTYSDTPSSPLSTDSVTTPSSPLSAGSDSTSTSDTGLPSTPVHGDSRRTINGPKYKLLTEGDIQVCRLNHTRTIVSKIMNSKYLRRWESHHVVLCDSCIHSTTASGFMEQNIPYSSIEDVNIVSRWDAGQKFCIRITISDGSVLLQAPNSYLRDQWLHSTQWMRHVYRYTMLLKNTKRPEVLLKEIKNMIEMSLVTPIQDEMVSQFPLELVSHLLQKNEECISQLAQEQIIIALAPLLEHNQPTQEICRFFSKHCKDSPRSQIVIQLFTPVVHRILKHNTDFGKYPRKRTFIQEYVQALRSQNEGMKVVEGFIRNMHGLPSLCPHLRVMPNLVAVCLSAIYNCYEQRKEYLLHQHLNNSMIQENQEEDLREIDQKLLSYIIIFRTISEFDDWRLNLASLLQPIPFPDDALAHEFFTKNFKPVIQEIIDDRRCEIHQLVLGIRDEKEGWFQVYCPGGIACDDEGEFYALMLKRLTKCCCHRKTFFQGMMKMISPCMLLALRDDLAAMDTLCSMLEYELTDNNDLKMQIITTLQSTSAGKKMYNDLCDRQIALRELQQKGGPKKLTLPSKSTDRDLARMLSSGSFGNLECLSLAFTQVTSACASELIKLPSLRYLNLWSTQFGDQGLQMLSEHMQKLQVLNLCETPVTDKGLKSLSGMLSLRRLNLNSTDLSALTFEGLKETLPALQECDVRYTDAW